MGVLSSLEPCKVFDFFEEICSIPHGSGNVEQIGNYLIEFAKKRNLYCRKDEVGNVIIRKEATKGYELEEGIIFQGHMDMVAVKEKDCKKDMLTEGLDLFIEGDYIGAKGTSLGADNGIAVAYALAVLDSNEISHPLVEVIITVDEETGMDGAVAIDLFDISSKRFLNLDSEEEDIFWSGCAGGARVEASIEKQQLEVSGRLVEFSVSGLQGGHSGVEIHKQRGNAILILAKVLYQLHQKFPFHLVAMKGGEADNAIPREASAVLVCDTVIENELEELRNAWEAEWKQQLEVSDPKISISVELREAVTCLGLEKSDSLEMLGVTLAQANGVQAMSQHIEGLVETSLNLGVITCKDGRNVLQYSVRSSLESAKLALIQKMEIIFALAKWKVSVDSSYPAWEFRSDSKLREKMLTIYENLFGKKPEVQAIHAGLECGIFLSKKPELDCVSIGPNMKDIHTPKERLSITSTQRIWELLLQILKEKE